MTDRLFAVVVPLQERAAAVVAAGGIHRRVEPEVEHGPAALAHPTAGEPLHRVLARDRDEDDAVERLLPPREERIERPRLRHRARKAVEQEALRALRRAEPLLDES